MLGMGNGLIQSLASTASMLSRVQLCDPTNCSLPDYIHGRLCSHRILQTRIRGWVAFLPPGNLPSPGTEPTFTVAHALAGRFFTAEPPREAQMLPGFSYSLRCKSLSRVQLFATPWTIQSMEFSNFHSNAENLILELISLCSHFLVDSWEKPACFQPSAQKSFCLVSCSLGPFSIFQLHSWLNKRTFKSTMRLFFYLSGCQR